ncbi:TPA: TldD/PmbA family protein [bacterium]|nr:TldD/PmbA family protein [bacterium]
MYGEILMHVLEKARRIGTEVLLVHTNRTLTRFANSYIHQNVSVDDIDLSIRVIVDNRTGKVSINQLSTDALDEALERAISIAKLTPPDPDYYGLPRPLPIRSKKDTVQKETDPEKLAQKVIDFIEATDGLNASGALELTDTTVAIVNSNGISVEDSVSMCSLEAVVQDGDSSGYVYDMEKDLDSIDFISLAKIASNKARNGQNPVELSPGYYTVILEPQAAGTLVSFLGLMGFGAKQFEEGRSFLVGKLSEKIASELINIWDYPSHSKTISLPFDFEGLPRQDVILIEGGIARNLVYDFKYAKKEGKTSTGNALPQPSTDGPLPFNLTLLPGDNTLEDMIASTKKGILVTRFHYTNMVDPVKTIITGMTRDGTFLIEDGEITRPVKNMRFTQSILEALNSTEAVGKDLHIAGEYFIYPTLVPALKLGNFHFTGVTR